MTMRNTRLWALSAYAGVGILSVAAVVSAIPPDWNWQTTWRYDSSGSVTYYNLDFSSSSWMDCPPPPTGNGWSLVLETTSSSSNGTEERIYRADEVNFFVELEHRVNYNITKQRWLCIAGGDRAIEAGAPPNGCQVSLTDRHCIYGCVQANPGYIRARVVQGVDVTITTSCQIQGGGTQTAGCTQAPQTHVLPCTGQSEPFASATGNSSCSITQGINVYGWCQWDDDPVV